MKKQTAHVCLHCGSPIIRRREPSGDMETISNFIKRKFCDRRCSGAYRQSQGPNAGKIDMCGMTWEEAARKSGRNVRTIVRLALKRAKELNCVIRLDEFVKTPIHQHGEHCQVLVTIRGKTHCIGYWLKKYGVPRSTYQLRVSKYGMSPKDALLKKNPRSKEIRAAAERDRQLSIALGGAPNMIQSRRSHKKLGKCHGDWTEEDIVTRPKQTQADAQHRRRAEKRKCEIASLGIVI